MVCCCHKYIFHIYKNIKNHVLKRTYRIMAIDASAYIYFFHSYIIDNVHGSISWQISNCFRDVKLSVTTLWGGDGLTSTRLSSLKLTRIECVAFSTFLFFINVPDSSCIFKFQLFCVLKQEHTALMYVRSHSVVTAHAQKYAFYFWRFLSDAFHWQTW